MWPGRCPRHEDQPAGIRNEDNLQVHTLCKKDRLLLLDLLKKRPTNQSSSEQEDLNRWSHLASLPLKN
jgi:hypothetical protein